MSQGKLGTDAAKMRGLAGDRYQHVAVFFRFWKILSIISGIGWLIVGVTFQGGSLAGLFVSSSALIYVYFLYSIVSFAKPLVDVAVNSYVNEELLKENTEYLRQLVEIEKFKLKNSRQNPSE